MKNLLLFLALFCLLIGCRSKGNHFSLVIYTGSLSAKPTELNELFLQKDCSGNVFTIKGDETKIIRADNSAITAAPVSPNWLEKFASKNDNAAIEKFLEKYELDTKFSEPATQPNLDSLLKKLANPENVYFLKMQGNSQSKSFADVEALNKHITDKLCKDSQKHQQFVIFYNIGQESDSIPTPTPNSKDFCSAFAAFVEGTISESEIKAMVSPSVSYEWKTGVGNNTSTINSLEELKIQFVNQNKRPTCGKIEKNADGLITKVVFNP